MSFTAQPLLGLGRVWHQRLRPAGHAFDYASVFLLLPMRSLRDRPCDALNRNRFGALAFFDRDHGDGGPDSLAWLEALVLREGIQDALGEVWLHTFPRVLGCVFNPVSFWYVHRLDGSLAAVVVEVNNTFGERHCYLLCGPQLRWGAPLEVAKTFHVSPFCAVEGSYRFRFLVAGGRAEAPEHTVVRIDHHDATGLVLKTGIRGELEPLTRASARRAFLHAPLHGIGVIVRIHWQALRLALKGLPFRRPPSAPDHFVTR